MANGVKENNYPFKELVRKREWTRLSDYIKENANAVKRFSREEKLTLTHLCCFDNITPIEIIQLINEEYPIQVRMLSHCAPSTPLHKAIRCRLDLEKLQYLLQVDLELQDDSLPLAVKTRDFNGRTPLHVFVKRFGSYMRDDNALDFASTLIHAYPEAVNCVDLDRGYTPVHCAVIHRQKVDLMQLLLNASPASALTLNHYMETPLHISVQMKAGIRELELMLQYGPDAVTIQDVEGRTPICWAWIRYVFECNKSERWLADSIRYDYQRRDIPNNFSKLQDTCVASTRHSLHVAFQRFWTVLTVLLSSPLMILHALCAGLCPNALLKIAIQLYPEQASARDVDGNMPLHIIIASLKKERIRDEKLRSPILAVEMIVQFYPLAASTYNIQKSLPLHMFLYHCNETYLQSDILFLLLKSYPNALRMRDGIFKLYPFMIAAMNASVTLCYQILKEAPEIVCPHLTAVTLLEPNV